MTQSARRYNIIALLLTNFFIIMPPVVTLLTTIITAVFATVMLFGANGGLRWETVLMTDLWANMLIITVLCGYMGQVMYRMYTGNVLNGIRLEETNAQLAVAARTDALTKLYNRRGFYERMETEWAQMHTAPMVFAAMIDVDYFKKYNDTFGHRAGDVCLVSIADILLKHVRAAGGIVCRYGGEEFLAFYSAAGEEQAKQIMEACRNEVADYDMAQGQGATRQVTISIGLSGKQAEENSTQAQMIDHADRAVYKAKEHGRNSLIFYRMRGDEEVISDE